MDLNLFRYSILKSVNTYLYQRKKSSQGVTIHTMSLYFGNGSTTSRVVLLPWIKTPWNIALYTWR